LEKREISNFDTHEYVFERVILGYQNLDVPVARKNIAPFQRCMNLVMYERLSHALVERKDPGCEPEYMGYRAKLCIQCIGHHSVLYSTALFEVC
jgi:hypothetical protein